jgi:glutaminyl-tRNA synthetase
VEPALIGMATNHGADLLRVQFMRKGYFCLDPDSTPARPVFNRTVTLKDGWKGISK